MAAETDLNCLSYWFPKIQASGLPVPNTVIVDVPKEALEEIHAIFDGMERRPEGLIAFANDLAEKGRALGYPLFLRTGHTSGKYNWSSTCFVTNPDMMTHHIVSIAEYCEMNDMMGGLKYDKFVLREMLPTIPIGRCVYFGGMPVCKEFPIFVDGETDKCYHPYWPRPALQQGGLDISDNQFEALSNFKDDAELRHVLGLASDAGKAVSGVWSVDVLETSRGWFVTDMAEARRSFHWEGCANGR